jgi:hypothetical protein
MLALLAGCSSASGIAPVHAALVTARQVQLTGTQLQAALVPESAFPPGYQYFGSTFSNSGDRLGTGPVKYKASSISCAAFAVFSGQAGWGETAFAGTAYARPLGSMISAEHGTEYLESVDQFAGPVGASSYWHGLRQLTARCPGLGSASPSVPVTQQISPVQLPGAQAFQLDITITGRFSGRKVVMRLQVWIVVAGQDVFYTDAAGINQPAPADPTIKALTSELITRVQNAR